ncbi:unnamed protein product, partial [Prorocentrum cordatum]
VDDKFPRVVQRVRTSSHGVDLADLNADSFSKLSKKEVDDTFSALRYQLSKRSDDNALKEYNVLKGDEDRRNWLAKFAVDPSTGGSLAESSATVTKRDMGKETDEWFTKGMPTRINSIEEKSTVKTEAEMDPGQHNQAQRATANALKRPTLAEGAAAPDPKGKNPKKAARNRLASKNRILRGLKACSDGVLNEMRDIDW